MSMCPPRERALPRIETNSTRHAANVRHRLMPPQASGRHIGLHLLHDHGVNHFTFGLQPILDIAAVHAAAPEIAFIRALPDALVEMLGGTYGPHGTTVTTRAAAHISLMTDVWNRSVF
jgi:hypothetical protein